MIAVRSLLPKDLCSLVALVRLVLLPRLAREAAMSLISGEFVWKIVLVQPILEIENKPQRLSRLSWRRRYGGMMGAEFLETAVCYILCQHFFESGNA